jgi:hypothetical protein
MSDPTRTALEAMIDRLEEIEDASIASSAASDAAWKTVHDLEAFIASVKAEVSSDVSSGTVTQDAANYALKILSRAHKAVTSSAAAADVKKNEFRGQIDILKWAISLVGDARNEQTQAARTPPHCEPAEDIKKRKQQSKS